MARRCSARHLPLLLLLGIMSFIPSSSSFTSTALQAQAVTIGAIGDSLTSCHGVRGNFQFAYLSYREPLWHECLFPAYRNGVVKFVGPRHGCNRHVDAAFPNATSFPNFHDSYFGRTSKQLLRDYTVGPRSNDDGALPHTRVKESTVVVGRMSLLLIGTNDLLLHGKANASQVADRIDQMVRILQRLASEVVLVAIPPPISLTQAKISTKKAKRFQEYIDSLQTTEPFLRFRAAGTLVEFAGFNASRHTYDGVHPNDKGQRVMARNWFRVMKPHLDKWLLSSPKQPQAAEVDRDQTLPWIARPKEAREDTVVSAALVVEVVTAPPSSSSTSAAGGGVGSRRFSTASILLPGAALLLLLLGGCTRRRRCL